LYKLVINTRLRDVKQNLFRDEFQERNHHGIAWNVESQFVGIIRRPESCLNHTGYRAGFYETASQLSCISIESVKIDIFFFFKLLIIDLLIQSRQYPSHGSDKVHVDHIQVFVLMIVFKGQSQE